MSVIFKFILSNTVGAKVLNNTESHLFLNDFLISFASYKQKAQRKSNNMTNLGPKAKEHSRSPFVLHELEIFFIVCHREIINRCGTSKLVAPRVDVGTSSYHTANFYFL